MAHGRCDTSVRSTRDFKWNFLIWNQYQTVKSPWFSRASGLSEIIVVVLLILGCFSRKFCPAWTTPDANPEPQKDVLSLAIPSRPPHAHSPLRGSKTSWTPLWFLIRNWFELTPKPLKTLDFLPMQSQRAHRTCVWAGGKARGKFERSKSESAQKKKPKQLSDELLGFWFWFDYNGPKSWVKRPKIFGTKTFTPTRSCQKFSKQICLWDLVHGIGIIFIIQIVGAIWFFVAMVLPAV